MIELLIVLTLLSMIALIMFAGLRVSVSAWEKGESDIELSQRYRVVLSLIKRQLSSVEVGNEENQRIDDIFFKGDRESMSFISDFSILPENAGGSVYVKYNVKQGEKNHQTLNIYENNVAFLDFMRSVPLTYETQFSELMQSSDEILFEYLSEERLSDGRGWQTSWDPQIERKFPLAVKVSAKEPMSSTWFSVIARIKKEVTF